MGPMNQCQRNLQSPLPSAISHQCVSIDYYRMNAENCVLFTTLQICMLRACEVTLDLIHSATFKLTIRVLRYVWLSVKRTHTDIGQPRKHSLSSLWQ